MFKLLRSKIATIICMISLFFVVELMAKGNNFQQLNNSRLPKLEPSNFTLLERFNLTPLNELSFTPSNPSNFPQKCEGKWEGLMYIYSGGVLRDSVRVEFNVAKDSDSTWKWRTDYLSPKTPITKDYRLKMKTANTYIIDEGDGIELLNYVSANKMYSLFETEGIYLTAVYELRGDELLFEVTSSRKLVAGSNADSQVSNFILDATQSVVFRKVVR
jgi:hypothetical protein